MLVSVCDEIGDRRWMNSRGEPISFFPFGLLEISVCGSVSNVKLQKQTSFQNSMQRGASR